MGGYDGDGGPAIDARLNAPTDVEVDADGSLYICDSGNNVVRKIDASGIITTIAGDGQEGQADLKNGDGGLATAARLNHPNGIALDRRNRLLSIADEYDQRVRVVRLAAP